MTWQSREENGAEITFAKHYEQLRGLFRFRLPIACFRFLDCVGH